MSSLRMVVTPPVIAHEENERSKKCKASSHLNAFTCGLTFLGTLRGLSRGKKIAPLQLQKYVQSLIMRSQHKVISGLENTLKSLILLCNFASNYFQNECI